MQSENIDNKIRQAAEQHHPDYDGKAWMKMEKLLDRHLPQREDRRRTVIFFFLLFLLMGSGAWLIISKPWQPRDQTVTESSTNAEAKSSTGSTQQTPQANSPADKTDNKVSSVPVIAIEEKQNQTIPNAVAGEGKPNQHPLNSAGKTTGKTNRREKTTGGQLSKNEQVTVDINDPAKAKKETKPPTENMIVSAADNKNVKPQDTDKKKTTVDPTAQNGQAISSSDTKNDKVIEQAKATDKKEKELSKKSGARKKNTFFFSFSAAPDVSSVGMNNPGKLKLLTGAGFGYTFKDRLTVRTGFYSGRKIYSATHDDYKPDITPTGWAYIDNIAADCKVYEIPLQLTYNFGQAKRHNWFAGAGLSSYIMKEEQYVYLYKWPNGSTNSYTKAIHDEYQHLFSVFTLSAGYQYKINRTFSISAEPYVKLPLTGVGYGNVKLNSAGVMFSLNMSPFHSPAGK